MLATDNRHMIATAKPARDRDATLRVLVETVERLAERVELLEARASLEKARVTADA